MSTLNSGLLAGIYSGAHPSDGGIAVGPQHVLQVVNRAFGIFEKNGTLLRTGALTDLLGVIAGTYLTDPRVLYDMASGRWIIVALQNDRTTLTSDLYWAVSTTSDPTGSYCYYSSDQTTGNNTFTSVTADFPGLGFDQYNFYITLQRFSWYAGYVADSKIVMVPRASILSCGPGFSSPAWRVSTTLPGDFYPPVLQPTQAFTPTGGEYFVASQSLGGSYIGAWQLNNAASPSAAALSYLGPQAVTPYRMPRPATQRGTTTAVNFSDARVASSAVLRNNSLYFAFTVGGAAPGTNDVRWYELSVAGLAIVQEGELGFTGGSCGFPAVMADAAGGLTLSAALTGVDYPLGAVVASRVPGDPTNQLSRPRIWTPSTATPYTDPIAFSTSFGERWGDYFGIALDTDGMQVWTEASYPTSATTWGTVLAVSRATTSLSASKYVLAVDNPTPTAGMSVRIRAQMVSSLGTPVAEAGHRVTWAATPPGIFDVPQSLTDATGVASVTFTTGTAPLTYVVTGTDELGVTGSTAPFSTTQRVLTNSVYLPNVTKTLGGPDGWTTPFIIQYVGAAGTSLDVSFYRFSDGALVAQRTVPLLSPGTSFADVPSNDNDLPADTQFSVVVKSYGSQVVAVVNEAQGTGTQFQSMSYTGVSAGATTAYLPNVTRRFYGWDVPFIIQNIDGTGATATATFSAVPSPTCAVAHSYGRTLTIDAGRSKAIDPNFEPLYNGTPGSGLLDGCQYSVVVTSTKQVAVVANATVSGVAPAAYSHNAFTAGATTLYAPYASLNGPGGRTSPIVVQNTGTASTVASLEFTPLGGGVPRSVTLPGLAPGASFAFDMRYPNGDVSKPLCTSATATCLASGEYSVRIAAAGTIAAVVLPNTATTAAAYSAALAGQRKSYMPNVTRALGGPAGWTTPIALQSTGATAVTLKWYRFSDGNLVVTQNLSMTPMSTLWIDPRAVIGLADNTQYAVVADGGATGTLTAIVYQENFAGGDGDMIYEGFGSAQ